MYIALEHLHGKGDGAKAVKEGPVKKEGSVKKHDRRNLKTTFGTFGQPERRSGSLKTTFGQHAAHATHAAHAGKPNKPVSHGVRSRAAAADEVIADVPGTSDPDPPASQSASQ